MTIKSSALSILLCCTDQDLQAQIELDLKKATVTAVKDLPSAMRAAAKRDFDAVILETKRGQLNELAEIQRAVDPTRTVIMTGPRSALRQASGIIQALGKDRPSNGAFQGFCLEDYIESKLGEFVKGMKNGSARNLHPMLIRAVERPLITLVLKETNGNQIQAAHVLGMNRNTLRKKITELRIPVKREKVAQA
jgi:two-component system nitrogen regulation response regulator GlnG